MTFTERSQPVQETYKTMANRGRQNRKPAEPPEGAPIFIDDKEKHEEGEGEKTVPYVAPISYVWVCGEKKPQQTPT